MATVVVGPLGDHGGGSAGSGRTQRSTSASPGSAGVVRPSAGEILAAKDVDGVVVVGNSLGAAVALAADSHRITARALVSPAGVIHLSVNPKLAMASAVWLLRPTAEHTTRMLRLFVGPDPPETLVEWMALMASGCRTTLAPPPLSAGLLARRAARPFVVGAGEFDRFLPPHRLAPAMRRTMNLDVRVFSGVGHLSTPADLDEVVSLVAGVINAPANRADADSSTRRGGVLTV